MAPDVAPLELLSGRSISLDAAAIEEEFSRIWRESAAAGDEGTAIRLRVLNFVAIAGGAAGGERFEAVMQALPRRHPCRGILARTVEAGGELEASIAAHCWRTGAGRTVCSEQVALSAPAGQEHGLASAVLALLVPEVPVAAWIIGEPVRADDLVAQVLESADTLLFDSSAAGAAAAALRHVVRLCDEYDVTASDLAWCRLTTWRALIAQLFDGDAGAHRLGRIRMIEIRGAGGEAAEALLLTGWLISRLRLSVAEASAADGGIAATLHGRGEAIKLEMQTSPSAEAPVQQVRVDAGDAVLAVHCHAQSGDMHVEERHGEDVLRRTSQRLADDDASLISRALDDTGVAGIYREAVAAALQLLDVAGARDP